MTGSAYSDFTITKRMMRFTLRPKQRQSLESGLNSASLIRADLGSSLFAVACWKIELYFPVSRFCLLAPLGLFRGERSQRKPHTLNRGNGKRKRRTSQKR